MKNFISTVIFVFLLIAFYACSTDTSNPTTISTNVDSTVKLISPVSDSVFHGDSVYITFIWHKSSFQAVSYELVVFDTVTNGGGECSQLNTDTQLDTSTSAWVRLSVPGSICGTTPQKIWGVIVHYQNNDAFSERRRFIITSP